MSRLIAFAWTLLGRLLERHQQPRFAAICYGMAVTSYPTRSAQPWLLWGHALQASQQFAEAAKAFEQAIGAEATSMPARLGLGRAFLQLGQFAKAVDVFVAALEIDNSEQEARNGLGLCYLNSGKPAQALDLFEQILSTLPGHVKARNNRVAALLGLGRYNEALEFGLSALEGHCRDQPGLHYNLGMVHFRQGKLEEAIRYFRESLRLDPAFDEAKFMLGILLSDRALLGDAVSYLEKKIAQCGPSLDLLESLSAACQSAGQLTKSAEVCQQIFDLNPDSPQGLVVQSTLQALTCQQSEALVSLERSMAAIPGNPGIFSSYLFILQTVPGIPVEMLFQRHREWADRFITEEPKFSYTPPGTAAQGKHLKVGYVSGDTCAHPVGFLLLSALKGREPLHHELHIYANNPHSDNVTMFLREKADHWCDTSGMSNGDLAERINADGIDILVELSGHTDKHRLPLMGYRAAPIQVSWIGYFHSTGLSVTDYFISDPFSTPTDGSQLFSETLVHLPNSRFCFTPSDFTPDVAPLACEGNGYITFGCFNRLDKINPLVVETWARILRGVPDSRLILKAAGFQDDLVRNQIFDRFAALGIAGERLELRERGLHREMLEQLRDIDISLDPFPFSGGMTTFECLTMGIPLVTLAGKGLVERQSVSALCNIGMPDLVFETLDAYVEGAIALAQDRARLQSIHERLRPALMASPLCDTAGFASDLDALYRRMWEAWCEGGKLPSDLASQRVKG